MSVEMTKRQGKKLSRYAAWCRIERKVKRCINEGDDYITIRLGGFEVKFDGTKGANDDK